MPKVYRSTISGAHGDIGFEPGDLVHVPSPEKEHEWLAAGHIELVPDERPRRRAAAEDED